MNAIIPLVLDTLSSAALIFFAAVGLTLVFNVLRVLNVAHGSFYSIGAYVAAGVSKFILRPAAKGDDDIMSQTRRLIDEVLPLVAARWPKPATRLAAE